MSLVLNEKYPKGSNGLFFKNRVLKIYPVYWLTLCLLIIASLFIYFTGHPGTISYYAETPLSISTYLFFIFINLFIVGYDLCYFFNIKNGHLAYTENFGNSYLFGFNSIGWTISLELIFYVIAPFILRKSMKLIVTLLLVSLAIRIMLTLNGLSDAPWNYMFFPTQIMFFMAGNLAYRLYNYIKANPLPIYLLKVQYGILLIIIAMYSYLGDNSYYLQSFLFIALTALIPASFQLTKNSKVDRYFGNLSYPLYISQYIVITFTVSKKFPKVLGIGFTTLLIAIILSIFIYEFVSKRIEKQRQKPFKKVLKYN